MTARYNDVEALKDTYAGKLNTQWNTVIKKL